MRPSHSFLKSVYLVVLDAALLALFSLTIVAITLGKPLGAIINAFLFLGYVQLLRGRRRWPGLVAAVVLAAAIAGTFFVITGRRQSAHEAPRPTQAMAAVLRSALIDYRLRHHGSYPSRLEDLMPEYAALIPEIQTPGHKPTNKVEPYGAAICGAEGTLRPEKLRDTGGWGFVSDPKAPCWGWVFIDCVHMDSDGKAFYSY